MEEIEEDEMPNLNVPRKSTKLNLRDKINGEYYQGSVEVSRERQFSPVVDQHFQNSLGNFGGGIRLQN